MVQIKFEIIVTHKMDEGELRMHKTLTDDGVKEFLKIMEAELQTALCDGIFEKVDKFNIAISLSE